MSLLSPKVDFIFKKIFGNEKNPDILISFLNAVLKPTCVITNVEIKNTDIEKEHLRDKFSRLDVKAKTSNNEVINIEIQRADQKNMLERTLYYWSKMYAENIVEGENYDILPKTICINILDYDIKELKNEKYYHNVYRLSNISSQNFITDKVELHFIELKKFQQCNINNLLDLWVEFMKNPDSVVITNAENDNLEIKKAKTELTVISADDKMREEYQIRQDTLREESFALNSAKQQGIEIGKTQGIEIGKTQGIEIGKTQGTYNAQLEIARKMLSNKEDIDKIMGYTGLTEKKIEEINKDRLSQ